MRKVCLLIALSMALMACTVPETENEPKNPRTETETLQKWFPEIEGVTGALWEAGVLGTDNSRLAPGPIDYYARGFLYIEPDVIDKWFTSYTFEEKKPDIISEYWEAASYDDIVWYYSANFNKDFKPGYYNGTFYLSRIGIWFDVNTT